MPKRTSRNNSRDHCSQPNNSSSSSTKKRSRSLTQPTLEESLELKVNIDVHINNVVGFFVSRVAARKSIKRKEIYKSVLGKAGKNFENIMNGAQKVLRNVYGLNVMTCDPTTGKEKEYIITNALEYIKDPSENLEECPEDIQKVLLLLVLAHIFMSKNSVSDASLYDFLKSLKIDVEVRHELFGNVRDYITKTLVKQQYIHCKLEDVLSKKLYFSWGQRAEKEISKQAVLEFVCKMYKDKLPKDWIHQFNEANQQCFENIQERLHIQEEVAEEVQ